MAAFVQDPRNVYAKLSALSGGYIDLPEREFVNNPDPHRVTRCPSLCFFVRHPTGKSLVFDLGLRKDWENSPPEIAKRFREGTRVVDVSTDVSDSLARGGVKAANVETVILSHIHYDHVGAHEQFPAAKFVVGSATRELLEEHHADPSFRDPATLPTDRSRIEFLPPVDGKDSPWKKMDPFNAAYDYFGDGSVYVIDAPGHLPGHINLVVRTGPKTYYYLGGDMCHDVRVLTGEKDISSFCDACGNVKSYYVDIPTARETVKNAVQFGRNEDLNATVIIAHDPSLHHESGSKKHTFFPGEFP